MGLNLPVKNVILDGKRWKFLRRYGRWSLEDVTKSEYDQARGRGHRTRGGGGTDVRDAAGARPPSEPRRGSPRGGDRRDVRKGTVRVVLLSAVVLGSSRAFRSSGCPAQETLDAQVFIHLGPMDAEATTCNLPIRALLR
jgi:hypothetical protein